MNEKNRNKPREEVQTDLSLPRQTQQSGGYTSQWQTQLSDVMTKIMNRENFTYDLNGDALWNQYKDQYMTGGKMAMMDTMGQAAALTGGYGNSYAQGVGQQAYQGYLKGLNDKIPELYQMALDSYNREGDALMQQYGLLADQEASDYSRYTDQRNYDYQVSQDQWNQDFQTQQFEHQKAQDQWNQDFQTQQFEHQQANDQWNQDFQTQQFEHEQAQDQWSQDFQTEQFEHQQANDQWAQDYQVSQDQEDKDEKAQQDARELAFAMLEAGTMPSEEMLAAAGLSQEVVGALYPDLMPGATGTAGASGNGNFPNVSTGSDWFANNKSGDGWLTTAEGNNWLLYSEQGQNWAKNNPYDASLADLDYAKNAGVITQEEYDALKTQLHTQYGK